MSIESPHVVAWRRLVPPWRWGTVGPALASTVLVLASLRRLDEREPVGPIRGRRFLGFGRPWWNLPVGRIDDHRRPLARVLLRNEHGIIRTSDVLLGASLPPVIATKRGRSFIVYCLPFLVAQELSIAVLRRPLQRNLIVVFPDTLEIRFAPRRLEDDLGCC